MNITDELFSPHIPPTTVKIARTVTLTLPPMMTEAELVTAVQAYYGDLDTPDAGDAVGMLELHLDDSPWTTPQGVISADLEYDRFIWSRHI